MSIYATLWTLKFPIYGDDHTGCDAGITDPLVRLVQHGGSLPRLAALSDLS